MINEVVAKKYAKALAKEFDLEMLEGIAEFLSALAEALRESKIAAVVNSPEISKEKRAEILLAAAADLNSKEVENFLKLLVKHNRVSIIGDIASVLKSYIADVKKEYTGTVYSDSDIDEKVLEQLSAGLGRKFDSKIMLSFEKNGYDGIKVDVEGLGIEIGFSRSRISDQIVEHILKAI